MCDIWYNLSNRNNEKFSNNIKVIHKENGGHGYNCNEKNYGYQRGGSYGGGGNSTAIFLIAVIVCSIIGALNELLVALIIVIVGIVLWC